MMELTLLAPTALSAACNKALAFWAAAGPTAGPSTRADTDINVTSTFFISLLPKSIKDRKSGSSLSQVAAERGHANWACQLGADDQSALPRFRSAEGNEVGLNQMG